MGLGKTIQVIALSGRAEAAIASGRWQKPNLLVVPASLLANWKAEMARFAPSLTILFVHPSRSGRGGAGCRRHRTMAATW